MMSALMRTYDRAVSGVERSLGPWLPGLLARFVFASVLLFYFWNSARTKVGEGVLGFFTVTDNAYYQIALPAVEAAGGDVSQVGFLPWGLIVWAGTYAEFALPLLIVLGLLTRIAAIGMAVFIVVQSVVDIVVHKVGAATTGAMFDRFSDGLIYDQRLLWLLLLAFLALNGAGRISLDALLVRTRENGAPKGAVA
jgi:putative oxidoreductase